ncbi:MAG: TonB-dependent receptor [Pseudomonadota bacterium]
MSRGILLAGVAFSILPGAAMAQTGGEPEESTQGVSDSADTDENVIIVTASKREATLQDTPIAVSVTTAEQIEDAQIRDILDIQTLVPSLRVGQGGISANTTLSIRGFGNGSNNIGIEPSVGVFVDGVYRSRALAQIGDLPNVQRVEVLRGPQSTLFGKNASAGVVSIVTRKPQFEFGGFGEISYGNFDALIVRGDVTGPITDTLAFSIGGNLNQRDGYIRDTNLNQDLNERDRWSTRGQLLFEPSEDLSFRLIADYENIDEVCCGGVNVVDGPTGAVSRALGSTVIPNNPLGLTSSLTFAPFNEIDNFGVSLQTDWSLGAIDFTAISAYRGVRVDLNQDSDFSNLNSLARSAIDTDIDTYTLELRAASNFDGPLNFLVGGFFFQENIDQVQDFQFGEDFANFANAVTGGAFSALEPTIRALVPGIAPGNFGGVGQGRLLNFDYANTAFSIFGEVNYAITDRLTATVGANFTNDRKQVVQDNISTDVFASVDLIQAGFNAALLQGATPEQAGVLASSPGTNPFLGLRAFQIVPPFLNFPNEIEDGRTNDSDLAYTLRLTYEASDNLTVYATHATGFKASSFNLSTDSRPFGTDFIPGSPFQVPPPASSPIRDAGLALPNLTAGTRFAGPEEATVYELGVKGQWQGFAFNLAIFDQTLEGFQANLFTGDGFVLGNAEEQSVRGFEFDTSVSPIPQLTFTAAITYLDATFDSFTGGVAFNPATFSAVPTDLSGETPAGIPEWSGSFSAAYVHEFGDGTTLRFYADYLLESNVEIAQGLSQFKRSVEQLNGTISLGLTNGIELTAWARNLTNAAYLQGVFPSPGQPGSLNGFRNQPRTYGGSIRFKF